MIDVTAFLWGAYCLHLQSNHRTLWPWRWRCYVGPKHRHTSAGGCTVHFSHRIGLAPIEWRFVNDNEDPFRGTRFLLIVWFISQ